MKYERNLSNGMKKEFKKGISHGLRKIFLIVLSCSFLFFSPSLILAVEEGSDHPLISDFNSEEGQNQRQRAILERYIRSADKIIQVFEVQTTTVLPNLDKISDNYKDVLVEKITEYNGFINNFTKSIYENGDGVSDLFSQILGDYRFLRKATHRVGKFNNLVKQIELAYELKNSTDRFIKNNKVSGSEKLLVSLEKNEYELNNLAKNTENSVSNIFIIINEMKLEEYSQAIDLLEKQKENYDNFVMNYNQVSDKIIDNAEGAIYKQKQKGSDHGRVLD